MATPEKGVNEPFNEQYISDKKAVQEINLHIEDRMFVVPVSLGHMLQHTKCWKNQTKTAATY
jgi:hypothetical protein